MKRFLTISVLLQAVTGLMTLALVSIFAAFAVRALQSQEQARRVPIIVDISSDLFSAIQDVRVERGAVNISLAAPEAVDADTQKEIVDLRARSGMALDSALAKLAPIAEIDTARAIVKIREGRETLAVLRDRVDEALHRPKDRRSAGLGSDWMDANGRLVRAIDDLSAGLEREVSTGDAFIADMIKIKQVTWDVRSASGDDRVHLREGSIRARDSRRMNSSNSQSRQTGSKENGNLSRTRLCATRCHQSLSKRSKRRTRFIS